MSHKYWNAPRDLETIPRSILRKIHPLQGLSSYPFLSGDTFRSMCAYEFNELGDLIKNPYYDSMFAPENYIFAHAAPDSNAALNLPGHLYSKLKSIDFSKHNLVIHNGDVIPSEEKMKYVASRFKKIHSVNWLGSSSIANPLPIGLENMSKRRNGVPADFQKMISKGLPSYENRDIDLLVCFSLHTNPVDRSAALEAANEIPKVHVVLDPMTPRAYRKLLLRSKNVLSPPGNGPDCHRTWESLYLGATPIVKSSAWPNFKIKLPVKVLNEWKELFAVVNQNIILQNSSIGLPDEWLS
jgi:hypothetical protein